MPAIGKMAQGLINLDKKLCQQEYPNNLLKCIIIVIRKGLTSCLMQLSFMPAEITDRYTKV